MTTRHPSQQEDIPHAVGLRLALAQARASLETGGVPIGAALSLRGQTIAFGHNQRVQRSDPTAHAEIDCLRNAGRVTSYAESTLFSTLAPCAMCAGAIIQFRIPRLVVGEDRTFRGELMLLRQRGVEVHVLDDETCISLMQDFIAAYPALWAEDIGERYAKD